MKLRIVRHAESTGNAQGRWHLDGHDLTNRSLWRINLFNDATHLD